MQHYVISADLASSLSPSAGEDVVEDLAVHHAAVGWSSRGTTNVTITLPGESLTQACSAGAALIAQHAGEVISLTVMSESERDRRLGLEPLPAFKSVTEAASALGISRQAVVDRIKNGTLPATRVGTVYIIPAAAVPA